jgi:ABC-type transport system involved in cytochrome bd biosynthesis fused ATPase/permease subunit
MKLLLILYSIVEATAAANRIISIRPSKAEKQKLRSIPTGSEPVSVEFRDVHFTYAERDVSVLGGVNLRVCHSLYFFPLQR